MHPAAMHILTNIKTGLAIALLATVGWFCVVAGASAAGGGNAVNAKLCQKGGWSKLMDSSAQPYASEDACVGYAAHGGTVYGLAGLHVTACANQPYDGLCVNTNGWGLKPGSVVTAAISQNGSEIRWDFPIVQGDGTVGPSSLGHFEIPCLAGNAYSASATGTSADSLTSPVAPGIPITSNTIARISTCP
jgi:hypothetical protein